METIQDKVFTLTLPVATSALVCSNSTAFHQEFQQLQEMILDWELNRVKAQSLQAEGEWLQQAVRERILNVKYQIIHMAFAG